MTDDELMARLGVALRESDVPPDDVVRSARASFVFNNMEEEFAALVADSLTSSVAVRRGSGARVLSFESASVAVELDVTADGRMRRVLGSVSAPSGSARWESPGTSSALEVDAYGRFAVVVPAGPVRLRIIGRDGLDVVTSWVTL